MCRGHGTHVEEDQLHASVAGVIERVNRLISVHPYKLRSVSLLPAKVTSVHIGNGMLSHFFVNFTEATNADSISGLSISNHQLLPTWCTLNIFNQIQFASVSSLAVLVSNYLSCYSLHNYQKMCFVVHALAQHSNRTAYNKKAQLTQRERATAVHV